jgi:hypothetical protein
MEATIESGKFFKVGTSAENGKTLQNSFNPASAT